MFDANLRLYLLILANTGSQDQCKTYTQKAEIRRMISLERLATTRLIAKKTN